MTSLSAVHEALHRLDGERIATLRGRSLLLTAEWSGAEIETLLDVADAFHALDRAGIAAPLFPNELDYALFFDASTRTKSSWAGAAARLGSQPVIVDGSSTQVSHGETAEETGAMLGMNAHALGIRHDLILGEGNAFMRDAKRGIDDYLAATGDPRVVPIVNLQCDVDHPTQTLADLAWLRQRFPEGVAGKTLAMTWAYSPSSA
ncbi:MAG: knotted carbamoyltransferase YgeW, partial [Acidobacteriota bacterium]|nr:knotted carbamoyltransferase YgeW [Acidobacteriota bacterium]